MALQAWVAHCDQSRGCQGSDFRVRVLEKGQEKRNGVVGSHQALVLGCARRDRPSVCEFHLQIHWRAVNYRRTTKQALADKEFAVRGKGA